MEDTDCLMRVCCGTARGFVLRVVDNGGTEVMRFVREFKCCAGCCWCASCDGCAFEVCLSQGSHVPSSGTWSEVAVEPKSTLRRLGVG